MIPLAALVVGTALAAAPADTGARWQAALQYGFEAFTRTLAAWQAASARLERRTPAGSLALEALTATRFGLRDAGGAAEAYWPAWRRAYVNARLQVLPGAAVLPRVDILAEAYQGLPGGWEISAGYRRMAFLGAGVDLWSASAARYAGSWYLRSRLTLVPQAGRLGASGSLLARRYLRSDLDLVELQAGVGREVVVIGAGPVVDVRGTRFVAARAQVEIARGFALAVAATVNDQKGLPTRRGLTVSVTHRW